MNKFLQEIFRQYKVDFNKLISFGFILQNDSYIFCTNILDSQMYVTLTIKTNETMQMQVFDLECNEEYTLYLAEGASGVFVGEVRKELEKVLLDLRNKCFDKTIFKSAYALKLIEYVKSKYGDDLEFLWDKSPNNAIWRRRDNQKWYCAMLTTKAKSIGIDSSEHVELIDFRESIDIISTLIDNKNYFPAYHMNKKHWLTIKLDDCTLDFDTIKSHIDNSYILAKKKWFYQITLQKSALNQIFMTKKTTKK